MALIQVSQISFESKVHGVKYILEFYIKADPRDKILDFHSMFFTL